MTNPRTTTSPPAKTLPIRRAPAARALLALVLPLALAVACDRTHSLDEIRTLQQSGRYADTIDDLRAHLEESPDDPELHLLYGTALSRTGAARVAVWSLRKAAESPDWTVPATLELSAAQARASNWDEAIAAADAVIEIDPENVPAHLMRGEARLSKGVDPEKALEDFELVLAADPTQLSALNSRASILLLLGRIDEAAEAIDQLEALVARNPADQEGQSGLCAAQAVLRQERGEIEDAEKRFDDCLEQFPSHRVLVEAAVTFFDARGDAARSDAILTKALELEPMMLVYRRTLAMRAEEAGDSVRALALLKEGLVSDNPEVRAALWTDVTNYHLDRDELPEAVAAYEEALALVENPPQIAILTHADLLARAGRHADALRVAKGLDNDAYVGLIEARVALDQGDPKRALARLDQVFPTWPNNAGARYYAARAAERMGDFARAVEEYRQAVRSAPYETEAGLRLAKLHLAAGSYGEAWDNVSQYVAIQPGDPEGARVMVAAAARDPKADLHALLGQFRQVGLWSPAVAVRLAWLSEHESPDAALKWLDGLPGPAPDWTNPMLAEALRARVLVLCDAGRTDEARALVAAALAAHPDEADFNEIEAALLERSDADPAAIEAAYQAALALDGRQPQALEGLARQLEANGDSEGALELYDRATHAAPESTSAARRAARLAGRTLGEAAAEKRWTALLDEHPWDHEAAEVLAALRRTRGELDATTLDYAERAVMFGGGAEARALLVAVHEARGEKERAAEVARAFAEGKPIPPRKSKAATASEEAKGKGLEQGAG